MENKNEAIQPVEKKNEAVQPLEDEVLEAATGGGLITPPVPEGYSRCPACNSLYTGGVSVEFVGKVKVTRHRCPHCGHVETSSTRAICTM